MEILELRERIKILHDDLVAAVRLAVPEGLNKLPRPFTAHIKFEGKLISLSVLAVLQDHGVHLMGTRISDGEKVLARDDQLDCETLLDVLVRVQTCGDFADGSTLLPEAFSEDDDVGKLLKMLVGVQKYFVRLKTKNGLRELGPYKGGDSLGLKLGQLDGTTAAYRLDGESKWREISIQF